MKFLVRKAQIEDVPEIVNLMNQIFGLNPKAEEQFKKWISNENFCVQIAKTKTIHNSPSRVVGIASCYVNPSLDPQKYASYGPAVVEFLKDQMVGFFLTLATEPQYRTKGIGLELAKMQRDWLLTKNCTVLVGTSWENGTQNNSSHLFKKGGFQNLGESREFMTQQSLQNGYECSICGHPCQCKAVFYGLKI